MYILFLKKKNYFFNYKNPGKSTININTYGRLICHKTDILEKQTDVTFWLSHSYPVHDAFLLKPSPSSVTTPITFCIFLLFLVVL